MKLAKSNHFTNSNYVKETKICLHTRVALTDNFIPEMGLFEGARGDVVEKIFQQPKEPSNNQHNHLPKYVVVDFQIVQFPQGYEPWDRNNPTVCAKCLL